MKIAGMLRNRFESLRISIDATLSKESSDEGALARYRACVKLAEEAIEDIRKALTAHTFSDQPEEIQFYKEEAPRVWGLYLYYKRLTEIEALRKVRSPQRFKELLQKGLRQAELFPERHRVCEYYYLGRTDYDTFFFTRHNSGQSIAMFLDKNIPEGTYRLAWMWAYQWLRDWLADALEDLDYQISGRHRHPKFDLTLERMQAIELLKAMQLAGVFKKSSFKWVMSWAAEHMGIEIGNFDNLLQDLQRRKIHKTVFLDKLKDLLVNYMDGKV